MRRLLLYYWKIEICITPTLVIEQQPHPVLLEADLQHVGSVPSSPIGQHVLPSSSGHNLPLMPQSGDSILPKIGVLKPKPKLGEN